MNMKERIMEYAATVEVFMVRQVAVGVKLTERQAGSAVIKLLNEGKLLVVQMAKGGHAPRPGIYSMKIGAKYVATPYAQRRIEKEKEKAKRAYRAPKLSLTEQAYRELRAQMDIKPIPDAYDYTSKRILWGKQNTAFTS